MNNQSNYQIGNNNSNVQQAVNEGVKGQVVGVNQGNLTQNSRLTSKQGRNEGKSSWIKKLVVGGILTGILSLAFALIKWKLIGQ